MLYLLAQTVTTTAPGHGFTLDVATINLLTGVVIPLLVALVAKEHADAIIKIGCNVVLSAISGALAVVATNNGHAVWEAFLVSIATTVVTSIVSYLGIWKPTGVEPAVGSVTGSFGIGTSQEPPAKAA